jgi:hypothetical protein
MSRSTSSPPLLEDGKLESLGDETHHVESDREKQSVGSNEPSTMASSTANGVEKPEFPEDDSPAVEEKAVDEPQPPPVEYPRGIEMFFIMLALVLVITLISLDQVCFPAQLFRRVLSCIYITRRYTDLFMLDHCCNRCSENYRPIRETSGHLMVRFSIFPNARSVPVTMGQNL